MVLSNPDSRVLYDSIHEISPSPLELHPTGDPIHPDPSFPSTSRPQTPNPYSSTAHPSAQPSMRAHLHGQSDLDNSTAREAYSVPPTADYVPPTPFTQYYRENAPEQLPETPTTPVPQVLQTQTSDAGRGDDSGAKTAEATPKAAPAELPEQQQSKGESPVTEKPLEGQEAEDPPETPLTEKPADVTAGTTFQPQGEPSGEQMESTGVVEQEGEPPMDDVQKETVARDIPVGDEQLGKTEPVTTSGDSAEGAPAAAESTNVVESAPEESASEDHPTNNDAQEPHSQPETPVEGEPSEATKTESQPQSPADIPLSAPETPVDQPTPPEEHVLQTSKEEATPAVDASTQETPAGPEDAPSSPVSEGEQTERESPTLPQEAGTEPPAQDGDADAVPSPVSDESKYTETGTAVPPSPAENPSVPETPTSDVPTPDIPAGETPTAETPVSDTTVPDTPPNKSAPDAEGMHGPDDHDQDGEAMDWDDDDSGTPSDLSSLDGHGSVPITPLTPFPPPDQEVNKPLDAPADSQVDDAAKGVLAGDEPGEPSQNKDDVPVTPVDSEPITEIPAETKEVEQQPVTPLDSPVADEALTSHEEATPLSESPSLNLAVNTPVPNTPTASAEHETTKNDMMRDETPMDETIKDEEISAAVPPTGTPGTDISPTPVGELSHDERPNVTPEEPSSTLEDTVQTPLSDAPLPSPAEVPHEPSTSEETAQTPLSDGPLASPAEESSAKDSAPLPSSDPISSPVDASTSPQQHQEEPTPETLGDAEEPESSETPKPNEEESKSLSPISPANDDVIATQSPVDPDPEKGAETDDAAAVATEGIVAQTAAAPTDASTEEGVSPSTGPEPAAEVGTTPAPEMLTEEGVPSTDLEAAGEVATTPTQEKSTEEASTTLEASAATTPTQEKSTEEAVLPSTEPGSGMPAHDASGEETVIPSTEQEVARPTPEESTEEADPSSTELEAAGETPVDESTPAATTPTQDKSTEEVAPPLTEPEGTTSPVDAKADEDEAVIGSLLDEADVGEVNAEEGTTKQQTAEGDAEREEKEDSPLTEKAADDEIAKPSTDEEATPAATSPVGETRNNEEVKTPVEATPTSSGELPSQVPTEPPADLPSADNTATPNTPIKSVGERTAEPPAESADEAPDTPIQSTIDTTQPQAGSVTAQDAPKELPLDATGPPTPTQTTPAPAEDTAAAHVSKEEQPTQRENAPPTSDPSSSDVATPSDTADTAPATPLPQDAAHGPPSPVETVRGPEEQKEAGTSEESQVPREPETPRASQMTQVVEKAKRQPPPPNPEAQTVPVTPTDDGTHTAMPNTPTGPIFSAGTRIPINESVLPTPYDQTPNLRTPADSDNDQALGDANLLVWLICHPPCETYDAL